MGTASSTLATARLGTQQVFRHPLSITGGQSGIELELHIVSLYRERYRRAEEGLRYAAQAHPSERHVHDGDAEVIAPPHGCFFTPHPARLRALQTQPGAQTRNSRRPT